LPDTIDAHLPEPGDLLYLTNPANSHGDPTWAHDFVVLGRLDRGAPSADPPSTEMVLACLGVSSITAKRPFSPATMVMLRHGPPPDGDPETGLIEPCAAQIDWPELIPIRQVRGKSTLQVVGARWNRRASDPRRRHIDEQTLAAIYRKLQEYSASRRG
jgi:hypothetical protein